MGRGSWFFLLSGGGGFPLVHEFLSEGPSDQFVVFENLISSLLSLCVLLGEEVLVRVGLVQVGSS